MGFLDKLFGNDHERAATRYADRESASDRAGRQRRIGHRRNLLGTARAGQAWEDSDRDDERQRRGRYRR